MLEMYSDTHSADILGTLRRQGGHWARPWNPSVFFSLGTGAFLLAPVDILGILRRQWAPWARPGSPLRDPSVFFLLGAEPYYEPR